MEEQFKYDVAFSFCQEDSASGTAPASAAPPPKFQKQLERIAQLPGDQQRVVMQMLDGVLAQSNR